MRLMMALSVTIIGLSVTGCVSDGPGSKDEIPPVMRDQIEFLITRIKREEGQALYDDLRRLSAFGPYAVPALIEALEEGNPKVRGGAAFTLGDIDDKRVVSALQDALDDRESLVRYEAARSLLYRGDWTGVPVLIKGLESQTPAVRFHCHEALRAETLQDFGFRVDGDEPLRADAIHKWESWWENLQEGNS